MNGQMDKAGRIISRPSVEYRPLYRHGCLPSREWQRVKLEALRYKWRYRRDDWRFFGALRRFHARHPLLMVWLYGTRKR